MNNAIVIFNYIFTKITDFLFAKATIAENVSIGHVFIMVNVFIILISNILNIPEGDDRHHPRYHGKTERGS